MSEQELQGREALAAELAMGLLDGPEEAEALALLRRDPGFAAEVADWRARIAPLLDEVDEVAPPPGLAARIVGSDEAPGAPVAPLAAMSPPREMAANDNQDASRKLKFWRAWSVGASAVAAALALVLVVRPPAPGPSAPVVVAEAPARPATPMVAALRGEDSPLRLVATWNPQSRQLVVAAASEVGDPGQHSHQLWVIPKGGKPHSLGVMAGNGRMHGELDAELAAFLAEGATVAVSLEPLGGTTSGAPTGPVLAAGTLETA